jgi:hypothetical protein
MSGANDHFGFSEVEYRVLRGLKSPAGIQDYLDSLRYKPDRAKGTCNSPRKVMKLGYADCIEGALFAAAALRILGYPPLVIDLEAVKKGDDDHVLAVFRRHGKWGAIGKSVFTGLGYRHPVYKDIRELSMSYFNDYFNKRGKMTLRAYSQPLNLSRFDSRKWMTTGRSVRFIGYRLKKARHTMILPKRLVLRNAGKRLVEADAHTPKSCKRCGHRVH